MTGLLQVIDVCKSFQGNVAVDHASLTVEEGAVTGLIGANGAGKTTLFNCISGYYHPNSGTILFQGKEIQRVQPEKLCRLGIGRTFQIVRPFGLLSVLDNAAVGGYNRGTGKKEAYAIARECLALVGLEDKLEMPAAALNTGEQRRLELARALATRPKLLLLDEVMAGLTPTESKEMIGLIEQIHQKGMTILMIEHIMPAIMSLSHRIYVMERGAVIADGSPEEVAHNPRVIASYLGSRGGGTEYAEHH